MGVWISLQDGTKEGRAGGEDHLRIGFHTFTVEDNALGKDWAGTAI